MRATIARLIELAISNPAIAEFILSRLKGVATTQAPRSAGPAQAEAAGLIDQLPEDQD